MGWFRWLCGVAALFLVWGFAGLPFVLRLLFAWVGACDAGWVVFELFYITVGYYCLWVLVVWGFAGFVWCWWWLFGLTCYDF